MSLKDLFPCHYDLLESDAKAAWDNSIIVLDTNILLNLYSYSSGTREAFFVELNQFKKNLWMPYQVAMEYQRNRCGVIGAARSARQNLVNILRGLPAKALEPLGGKLDGKTNHDFDAQDVRSALTSGLEKFVASAEMALAELPHARGDDKVRNQLEELFRGKIGPKPASQDAVDQMESDAESRFKEHRPPGFGDEKKEGVIERCDGLNYRTQYGDYVLWEQVLSHAAGQKTPKNLIFVTEDREKRDWWREVGGDKVGPHYSLAEEYFTRSKGGRMLMYDAREFLTGAGLYRSSKIKEEVLDEVTRWSEVPLQKRASLVFIRNRRIRRLVEDHYFNEYGEVSPAGPGLAFIARTPREKVGFMVSIISSPEEVTALADRAVHEFREVFQLLELTAGVLVLVTTTKESVAAIIQALVSYYDTLNLHGVRIGNGPIMAEVFFSDGETLKKESRQMYLGIS